jgi:hypothetical protein
MRRCGDAEMRRCGDAGMRRCRVSVSPRLRVSVSPRPRVPASSSCFPPLRETFLTQPTTYRSDYRSVPRCLSAPRRMMDTSGRLLN